MKRTKCGLLQQPECKGSGRVKHELCRELQGAVVTRARYLAKQTARHGGADGREVGMIQQVEGIDPKLHVQSLHELRTLHQ